MAGTTRRLGRAVLAVALLGATVVADGPIKVFKFKGTVRIKRGADWGELRLPCVLEKGDEVETGKDGEADAKDDVGTRITIRAQSNLVLVHEEDPTTYGLKRGSAYFSVISKTKKQGFSLKIKTRVGVTGVRGTKGLASFGDEGMQVAVVEAGSLVQVKDTEGKEALLTRDEFASIQVWEKAVVAAVGTGKTQAAAREDGIRRLKELIDGVVVYETTRVRDFLAANAGLRAQLDAFIGTATIAFKSVPGGAFQAAVSLEAAATKSELGRILGKPMGKHLVRVQKGLPASVRSVLETIQ